MKTLTCREMGGMCDEAITASSKEEMMNMGMAHLNASHPEMAASIMAMPKDDPQMVEWQTKFDADYEAAPEHE